jgi:hypothetical protein
MLANIGLTYFSTPPPMQSHYGVGMEEKMGDCTETK